MESDEMSEIRDSAKASVLDNCIEYYIAAYGIWSLD